METELSYVPSFDGKQYRVGDQDYDIHRYQYSYSSHIDDMKPAVVLYANNDADVKAAIAYAKANGISVALRTGGHQYSGASSTKGRNIQLDLNEAYKDFDIISTNPPLVRCGISFSLAEFNTKIKALGWFIPHGQCSHVHLGGHVQSGGYGMMLRAFGLFGDHVQKIRVITADGEVREVSKGDDLYLAILGGSPGNYGVLTHVYITPHRDVDHPNSRGYKAGYLYTREKLQALLKVTADWANNNALDGDYDLCVTTTCSQYRKHVNAWLPFSGSPSLDTTARLTYGEDYGKDQNGGIAGFFPTVIVVYAQWSNLKGADQKFDDTLFKKLQEAGGTALITSVDYKTHTPLSQLARDWVYFNVREFDLPYEKRTWFSKSKITEKYLDAIVEVMDSNVKLNKFKVTAQFQPIGGQHSSYRLNGKNENGEKINSYSWRDSTFCTVIDCFHKEEDASEARTWQEVNDALHAQMFESPERRVLWGSFGEKNLARVWDRYYETREKYDRLVQIKDHVDPRGVFSANAFCVGGGSERGLVEEASHVPSVTAGACSTVQSSSTGAASIDARVMQNRKDSIYQQMRKKYPKFKRTDDEQQQQEPGEADSAECVKKRDLQEEVGADPNDTKLKKQKKL